MFKKILCLAMVLIMVAGMAVIGVSAADEKDTKLYFQVPSDWNNYTKIYCHIWPYGGDALANWQSKKEACTDEGNGIFSYDPAAKVSALSDGVTYCVIFSANTGMQTYDAVMTTACFGDTLYCDGNTFENPEDSNKTALSARWKNNTSYGPVRAVTSIGNIVGETYVQAPADMFADFLANKLGNARTYSKKDDQTLIDDVAKELGLGQDDVEKLIKDSGITDIKWTKAESKAPVEAKPAPPAVGGAIGTGQEMTIVYVAITMMVASAGVIFFARKKRVTE